MVARRRARCAEAAAASFWPRHVASTEECPRGRRRSLAHAALRHGRDLERRAHARRYLDASAPAPALRAAVTGTAACRLGVATFGGLDFAVRESHAFELQIFTFAAMDTLHA
jgi:hypothetical protein